MAIGHACYVYTSIGITIANMCLSLKSTTKLYV